MTRKIICRTLLLALLVLFSAGMANATLVGYTDYDDFYSDLTGTISVLDFDDMDYGETISSGDTIDNITFSYDFGGIDMMVSDYDNTGWETTSPDSFLGTTEGDLFLDGDDFSLSFTSEVNAIGMYIITSDEMWDNDITLTANGYSVGLASDDWLELDDGSLAFFLGIIDTEDSFSVADITTLGEEAFFFNVDDITTSAAAPVPEPATCLLLGMGLAGMSAGIRKLR